MKIEMKTSCRFAMAVHVLAVLAYKEGDPVTSSCLADSVNTNPVVIRRLLLSLQRAKLVETRKGAGAGSRLSRSAQRVNLAEIYRAVEEPEPFSSPARKPNAGCPVGNCIRKTLEKVFVSAENALERDLQKTTLADVVQTAREACMEAGKRAV
jgi:Rrf2 family protein